MKPYVVVATRGRADATRTLIDRLGRQATPPSHIIVVGAEAADVAGLESRDDLTVTLSRAPGLTRQRNVGLDALQARSALDAGDSFVAFFDDDYRPAKDWLEQASRAFAEDPSIAGLTGLMLADGVRGPGLREADADAYIEGERPPMPHWASGPAPRDLSSLYGCNMAFRANAARALRFDERLPLYGWQEDRDYSQRARAFGRIVYWPACRGVHLGLKGGRVSGVRLGYSQIANPLYLGAKGTMSGRIVARFVMRAAAANVYGSLFRGGGLVDYRGRLNGNLRAAADLARGRCRPERAADL